MKKLILFWTTVIVTALSAPAIAQEICDNGIDDDFDGFIDCYDPDCSNHSWCDGFYIGNDVLCEAVPSQFPEFRMTLDFASRNETTNHIGRMVIGDLDRDGLPEIITLNKYTKELIILEGNDPNGDKINEVKIKKTVSFTPNWEVAIGNIDNDNCAEIFFQGTEGNFLYMYAYDCNLNQIWRTQIREGNYDNRGRPRPLGEALDAIMYGLADFDGDGKVELYLKDMILDAHTGTIIVNTSSTDDASWNRLNGGPTAVDILGNTNLELILGCKIYDVNLGARTANSGTITLLQSLPEYEIKHPYNATSIADYNLDGDVDIIASGGEDDGSGNLVTTIFMWDVTHNIVKKYSEKIAGSFTILGCPNPYTAQAYQYGWVNGTGRINIGDLDGDGKMNASYVSGKYLYALDENLNLKWRKDVKEETSGFTGCTLFDFNGDGKSEIVYRDEQYIYIINGTDGTEYPRQPCISRTQREYPIVADVDADGYTELCVTCGFDDVAAVNNFCNLNYSQYSHVRVYKSAAEPWVPARRLWNQHGYFNVNVNDDLTIPRRQQQHHLVWSVGNCTQGPNRPLNNFLNQSPFLNSQGCPTYAAPNLAYVDNSLSVNPPTCPDGNFTVSFQIQNLGDIDLSGDVPITFYNGDPTLVGATKLNTISVTVNSFGPGDVFSVTNATVNGPGSNFTLYIVLNDGGTTVPTPISLPNTNFIECDYSDNIISAPVNPLPVTITALKVKDNVKCLGSTSPDNGAVRAFIPVGATENITDYNFYWSIGPTAKPVASADHVGATYNNIADGTYTVYAIHKTANCSSDTATVLVDRIDGMVSVQIVLDNPYDNCKNPNAKLRAVVNGGDPVGKFTYAWYEGNDIFTDPQIGVSHIAADLKPVTYTVLVTEKATGCQSIESYDIPDQSVAPVVDVVKTDLLCTNSTSGSISVTVGGNVAMFTFEWYNGNTVKPSPDFTGDTYSNRPAGNYTVVATNNSTKCSSAPVTVTLIQTIPPVVTATTTANQTSCDMSLPNGAADSNVGGLTTGYAFEWFKGQNTLAANRFATTSSVAGLAAGIYTVKATDNVTGCSDTEEITVISNVVTPTLIVGAITTATNCNNPNGSITVNVSLDAPSDYTFSWYIGNAVKASPDFTTTTNILSGLVPGDYTVQAVHNTKHCLAAPITVTVIDGAPPISIILDNLVTQLPSDCNANDGTMRVDLSAPGNSGGFDVSWYVGHEPFSNPPFFQQSGVTSSTASNLNAGMYSVVAINRDNGCQNVASFDLPFANAHRLVFRSKVDVDKCAPTDIGQITFDLIKTPLAGFDESDYDIHVYKGSADLGLPVGAPVSGNLIQVISGVSGLVMGYNTNSNLAPGYYALVAISKNPLTPDCRSVPLVKEIKQIIDYPVIVATQIDANTNCAGIMANGQIEITIDGVSPPPGDYSIQWFAGPDTSSPTIPGGLILSNLSPGMYTVEVTNTKIINTQCTSTATFQVLDTPPVIGIASSDITIMNLTRCDFSDASAAITGIQENGMPGNLGDYSFEWFFDNMAPMLPNGTTKNGLAPGTYFVKGTNIVNNCASTLLEFEIEDMTMGTVGVDLLSYIEPTQCLKPANITGEFHIQGTGNSGTGYTYNWYSGATASGPIVNNAADFTGLTVPGGQTDITYTVEVINNDNQCKITDTYTLSLIYGPINITASTSPLTSCAMDDGTAFATVTTANPNSYDYYWYIGNTTKPVTDFPAVPQPAKQISGLAAGEYTVVAVDPLDAACLTPPLTVMVDNMQEFPVVVATALAPVTNCDPARPNGVAAALVDGNFTDYIFEWFVGPTDTGVPIFTGSDIGNLSAGEYTVRATDLVSGCANSTSTTIEYSPLAVPSVEVEVLSNVTSCVAPNGALSASVGGNTADYTFDWFIGSVVKPVADYTGEIIMDLPLGTYTVTATSKITGCVSAPVSKDIIEELAYPDFDFDVQNSACIQDGNGDGLPDDRPSGLINLIPKNGVDMVSIEWVDQQGNTYYGAILAEVEAGIYTVTATSSLGCSTTKEVMIKTDIRPYNGISRNGDDKNYLFHINCIGDFPDNIVKIFNRAGTLVYQAQGYDNIDIYFDGRANKGITPMGNNLPDGTYFYVIDKRDGSKPLAGYLEIVN
ncbi:MAG TPA: gliding motility-associated C-terminal domain-containing protein [Cyclobacteriaceae bacterium]|nr:gliding motility-associated C-terminal domain-containing protein [Cyclobacteriaceae bacterium]